MIEQDLAEPSLPPAKFTPAPAFGDGPAAGIVDFADVAIKGVASVAIDASQFEAAYNAQRYDGDQFARMNALSASADRRNVEIQKRTGATLENPFEGGYDGDARARLAPDERLWGDTVVNVTTQARRPFLDDRLALHQQRLADLSTQYPDHAEAIGANRPLLEDAKQLADYWTRRAATGGGGLNAVSGAAAGFLGSAAGFMRNPANLTLTLLTGGAEPTAATLAGKMAQMFFREGTVNAGFQAFAEPAVQSFRAERGQDAGIVEAAKDVGAAFLFGGAFGAAIPAAKSAFARFIGSPKAAEAAARGGAQAHEADMAVLADAPPARGLDTAFNQALDRGEGVRDVLPEIPAMVAHDYEAMEALDRAPQTAGETSLGRIEQRARELSPKPFARADELDNRIASARAEMQRVSDEWEAQIGNGALSSRIEDLQAQLGILGIQPEDLRAASPFEAAQRLRVNPELVRSALASPAPDMQTLGRLASLGDAAFEEARAGRVSTEVALATAARVTGDAEQLATMRGAQTLEPKTTDEAAAAVSREMEARSTPRALQALHAIEEPAAAVPAPKFRRETEGARDKQIEALKGEIERSDEQAGGEGAGAPQLKAEPGAEGKPQTLIPGVEPISDKQRAELAASKPLRGGAAEPSAGGLFDEGARAQMDLLDLTPTEDGRAVPAAELVADKTREQLIAEVVSRCPF